MGSYQCFRANKSRWIFSNKSYGMLCYANELSTARTLDHKS